MDTVTFRCKSCAALLRAPAAGAGQKVHRKKCGAAVIIPADVPAEDEEEDEAPPAAEDRAVTAERPRQPAGDDDDDADQAESAPARRRKRRRGRRPFASAAELRSASGWRKVRLGLILIAVSMCMTALWFLIGFFVPLGWLHLHYVVQALPIAGNILCAFVPLKGVAQKLALANLGVIAAALALTVVADWRLNRMVARATDAGREITRKSEEFTRKIEELSKETDEERELGEKMAELGKKARAGDKAAAKEQQELSKKLSDLRTKRIEGTFKQATDDYQAAARKPLSGLGFWGWLLLHGHLLSSHLQIIILAFFIQAVASALDDRSLATTSPRVAWLALVSLILFLLGSFVPYTAVVVHRLLFWIAYLLGLVSFVWQGLMLIEACTDIGNHLNRKGT
jgi:hypothetical protein